MHEAFLVSWLPLKNEIDAHAATLRARRRVESAANDWVAGGHDDSALLEGPQLEKAIVDFGAGDERRSMLSKWWPGDRRLGTRVDLNEVGRARVDLDEVGRTFLEASIRTNRYRQIRLRRLRAVVVGSLALLTLLAILAATGLVVERRARVQVAASERQAVAYRLILEADMLANRGGDEAEGLQRALAARALDPAAVERFWPTPFKPDVCDELDANMSHEQWRDWVSPNIEYIEVCPQLPVPPD